MSRITSVASVAYTLTAPFKPAGTIAALALMRPSKEFSVETKGCGEPDGQSVRNASAWAGTTVAFSE